MVAFARFQQLWEAAPVPRKATAIHDDSSNRGTVATDELGRRVHHDVRAMLDRTTQVRRGERIVNNQGKVICMRDTCNRRDV
jgi:hypothetical protein